ncbi:MAG: hypothetical protein IJV15_07655 [Lachnospiraceae bacterium]|nr:hypothetical protein [Lachnospiraceae bacterium]
MKKKFLVFITVFTLLMSNFVVYAEDGNDGLAGNGNEDGTFDDDYEEETVTLKELLLQGEEFVELDEVYSINTIGNMLQTLKAGKSGLSGGISLTSGGTINIGGAASPTNKTFRIGILQPDGVIRYASGSGNIVHTFSVTQTGTHKVYIHNASDVTMSISVSYSY